MKKTTYKKKEISEDDVLRAMEQFDRELRASFPANRWVTYAVRHNGQLYPPKQIMRFIIGVEDIGRGGEALNSCYKKLEFEIINIDKEEIITDQDSEKVEAIETSFSLERDLENSLVSNLSQLENGLQLYKENGVTGRQVDAKVAGRIDILAIDLAKNLVVIELKAGEADDKVCGQIQRYMGWVKENIAKRQKVRGIIIANDFSERLIYAAKVVPDLSLKRYQISFKFTES